jgi:uncharacterized membrane protein YozB (DUF420 family)
MTAESLPAINATLNGCSAILLTVGYVLIRRRQMRAHGMVMLAATISSALFLAGYLVHKFYYPDIRLSTRFPNLSNAWRYTYWFAILIPHLVLAVVMLPFIALGLWHAAHRQFDRHKRVNRITIWMWLYVSVTGVIIYFLLYHVFPVKPGA